MPDDFDFSEAMKASAAPEPQACLARVTDEGPTGEITMPVGTNVRPTALSLVPYEEKVKILVARARELQVIDADSQKEATSLALQAKRIRLRVEGIKKSPTYLTADQFLKEIRHLCKALTDPLHHNVEQVCKDKLGAYDAKVKLERQRQEAVAREEARRMQAELDAETERQRQEAVAKARVAQEELERKEAEGSLTDTDRTLLQQTVEEETSVAESIVAPQVVVQVTPPETVVRTEEGASFTKTRWVAKLVDEAAVERKYLVVDMKLVQKDVDSGVRSIPGFLIEQKTGVSIRG